MANDEPTDLDWLQLRRDMGPVHRVETTKEKFIRKFSENPFVPIGCLATAGALSYGLWCFRTKRSKLSQKMMRVRIVAQGFTIAALVVGVVMGAGKSLKNN
ncbi:HIG1 domain family member 2A, mitochondrial [Maniola jurtina]|uniref:HIG1 domain family member 2A, mitochondrial n=1 Tax=Maniola jurtina TaxID=191418 RepID=UPI001E68B6FA|nr:HIG1 domain family member 2A, mitochondrial [Maniola jurtina]